MKFYSVILVSMILGTVYLVEAKPRPMVSIDLPIPIPGGPRSIPLPIDAGSEGSKAETSKEVETMDKAESAYFGYGYYPYYNGYPYYGYHYPLVYVG